MQNNVTELVFILDKSGSMRGLEADTIGGFNAMLAEQRGKEGRVVVSTVLFSNYQQVLHNRVDLSEVKPLTEDDYHVGGCTALLDAIGRAIRHISWVHKKIPTAAIPDRTLFLITTDGMENASREYSYELVKAMIKQQEQEYGWEFLFVAANIDAAATAEHIGIRREHSANYNAAHATREMYGHMGRVFSKYIDLGELDDDWSVGLDDAAQNKPSTSANAGPKDTLKDKK